MIFGSLYLSLKYLDIKLVVITKLNQVHCYHYCFERPSGSGAISFLLETQTFDL